MQLLIGTLEMIEVFFKVINTYKHENEIADLLTSFPFCSVLKLVEWCVSFQLIGLDLLFSFPLYLHSFCLSFLLFFILR